MYFFVLFLRRAFSKVSKMTFRMFNVDSVVIFTNKYSCCLPAPKMPDILREQLKAALKEKDRFALEKIILQCEAAAFPELGSDLRRAREVLQDLGGGRGGQHFTILFCSIKSSETMVWMSE